MSAGIGRDERRWIARLEHDPERCTPVFGKIMLPRTTFAAAAFVRLRQAFG
jgi:hypothetical protein